MKIERRQTFDIEIPKPPTSLKVKGNKNASIPIADLAVADLEQIGKEWTAQLIDAAYPKGTEQPAEPVTDGE